MAITTNTEMKVILDNDDATDDALLTILIANAEAQIDKQTHRQFTAGTATRKFHAINDVTGLKLWLDEDLISITTLTNGDSNTIASSKYVLLPANQSPKYAVLLLPNSALTWNYDQNPEEAISIAGSWGYSTTVPADIKYAVQLLTTYYYRSRGVLPEQDRPLIADGIVIAPAQAPRLIAELTAPYKKVLL